jgi:tRNA-specific 2-thiouridylase
MDARAVAEKLQIPFYVVDTRLPFKKEVTDYFIKEYEKIRTPNPCVICNRKIKFGWLLDLAKKSECDFLATGHYAKVKTEEVEGKKIYHLYRGKDLKKDQSYFLSGLNQNQLSSIIFPLGDLTKEEVRKIAEENDLPVYNKTESQEVCFVEGDYRDFLKNNASAGFSEGEIVDSGGDVLGNHHGLVNYTIGQRKGINQQIKGSEKDPLYVKGFDLKKNRLIVGKEDELYQTQMNLIKLNLINPDVNIESFADLKVKVRYGAPEVSCSVDIEKNKIRVKFASPQRAITPGQFAVFYSGQEVIGNAEII